MPRRLLGDAVLRETAWKIATEHGSPETYEAEYIALTSLHGQALVAENALLRKKAPTIVRTITVDDLLKGS